MADVSRHRIVRTLVIAACAISVATGLARTEELSLAGPPMPPIRPDDIGYYCIYGNKIYSVGSQLCVDIVRTGSAAQSALTCNGPSRAGERATWTASGGTPTCLIQPSRP